MKALILVGGYGTRLRPLTFSLPKPVVPFANKAILLHQIEALAAIGVSEVVLAVSYQPEKMMDALAEYSAKLGIRISTSLELTPLGTAGPLKLAEALLRDGTDPFFVLNSDVICEFPFASLLEFHRAHGREGTIFVTKVDDPSKYGVVVSRADGHVERFVEKPTTFVGDRINAGMYILNPSVLDRIPAGVPVSIEKEVFPLMAADGQLYSFDLRGYWMDIGQPPDYLRGQSMHLAALPAAVLASGPNIIGAVLVDPSATVAADAVLGPDVVVGPGCVVESGARVSRSALLARSRVRAHALVRGAIIGWDSTVGRWARCEPGTVLGEDVQVADEAFLNGAIVCPHKGVKDNVMAPTIIM